MSYDKELLDLFEMIIQKHKHNLYYTHDTHDTMQLNHVEKGWVIKIIENVITFNYHIKWRNVIHVENLYLLMFIGYVQTIKNFVDAKINR